MTNPPPRDSAQLPPAPPNNLPSHSECAQRVHSSDFIAKRVAEGGHGPDADSRLATELHRFINEYDDADPYRSAWFLHRLELLLDETKREALRTQAASMEPVAWQSRFKVCVEWSDCSKGHYDWVKRAPEEFPSYEVRELFATPPTSPNHIPADEARDVALKLARRVNHYYGPAARQLAAEVIRLHGSPGFVPADVEAMNARQAETIKGLRARVAGLDECLQDFVNYDSGFREACESAKQKSRLCSNSAEAAADEIYWARVLQIFESLRIQAEQFLALKDPK